MLTFRQDILKPIITEIGETLNERYSSIKKSVVTLPLDERFSKVLLVLTANLWKARLHSKNKHLAQNKQHQGK